MVLKFPSLASVPWTVVVDKNCAMHAVLTQADCARSSLRACNHNRQAIRRTHKNTA